MTNKYLKKFPSFSLKPYTVKHDERKHMVKLCRRKLKNLQNKGTISVKSVLIKNTLKVMEKQNLLDHFDSEDDGVHDIHYTDYIDSLLNEIDLDNTRSDFPTTEPTCTSLSQCTIQRLDGTASINSNLRNSEVLEDFHNNATFSTNKLIFKEDPNEFFEFTTLDDGMYRSNSERQS